MTQTQAAFFQILRDYLRGDPSNPPADLDWEQVCQWADSHKLGGIVFAQCAPWLRFRPELMRRMNTAFGAAVSHWTNLQEDYALLTQALDRAGVPYIPIKGAVIAASYPNPELRTMGDIDLLVRREDRDRIADCLTPLGFRSKKWAENEWDYVLRQTIFELQAELMDDDEPDIGQINAYFNDFWPHAVPGPEGGLRLEPSFHFFYLIAHIAKHLRWVGVGFRQFYDLAVLMTRGGEAYDWDWIREQAESIGFFRFTACALAMTERWFGVPSPYGTDCLPEELFEEMTEKIFSDGVFGFQNEGNRVHALETAQRSTDSLTKARAKAALKLAFPPYRDLITSPKYAYLRGKPWLLPYAWCRRAIRGRGSENARDLGAVLTASQVEVTERSRQLRDLGL